jgi:alpha-galactosidase
MQGALGIGANLNKWTPEESQLATQMIAYYKSIRPTVQEGNLYRLLSPLAGEVTANEYVAQDGKQAVLFAFIHSPQYRANAPAIRLAGLDAKATYRLKTLGQQNTIELSGAYLMQSGVTVQLRGDYDSTSVLLERE